MTEIAFLFYFPPVFSFIDEVKCCRVNDVMGSLVVGRSAIFESMFIEFEG
jgi:hypothetical protein